MKLSRSLFAVWLMAGASIAYAVPSYNAGPAASATTATTITDSFTPSASATAYAVAYRDTLSAPTCTQVKAGQDQTGVAAAGANSKAVTGADTIVVTVSGTALPRYNVAHCLNNGTGDSAVSVLTARTMAAPNGYQFITLASIGAGSPCADFNVATSPDLAAGDILRAVTTTDGGLELTVGTDCQFSYSGAASRQLALNNAVYDASVGAYHADDIDFIANNLAPIPPEPGLVFFVPFNSAMTPVDLAPYCDDPEADTITVTNVTTLPTGLSIVSSTLQGTATVSGITRALTFRCTDTYGATADWE